MAISSSSGVDNGKFHDFLLQPTEITKVVIDFKKTDLPEYKGLYATVLDNVFTEQACQTLINMAESTARGEWEEAMVNIGNGKERSIKEIRDCGRIIWDGFDMVATIWARIKDQVPEVLTLKDQPLITGYGPVRRNETWKMSRLNERMRFLKYQEGQYFKRKYIYAIPSPLENMNLTCAFQAHEDGSYVTPNGKEMSFYTLHLYLNSNPGGGGATTFHSDFLDREINVEPKPGRVLIFQHRGLLHSGADVIRGTKYTMRTDLMYKKVDE